MTFRLTVDLGQWQRWIDRRAADAGAAGVGLVPVVKGNGYGFGAVLCYEQCRRLGLAAVAVGTLEEAPAARRAGFETIVVLNPLTLDDAVGLRADPTGRLVRVVSRKDVAYAVVRSAPDQRVLLELASPLRRHGLSLDQLRSIRPVLSRLNVVGVTLHLPMTGDRLAMVRKAMRALDDAGVSYGTLWVSHLNAAELAAIAQEAAPRTVHLRSGTALWLGDRTAFTASGLVLERYLVGRRDPVGYAQSPAAHAGTVLVVSGGTAHGVGVRVDGRPARLTPRGVARTVATACREILGHRPSPFSWHERRLEFADSPHMHQSLLLSRFDGPDVGERVRCATRMTLSRFDEVLVAGREPSATGVSVLDRFPA